MHVSWPFAVSAAYPLIQNINFEKKTKQNKSKWPTLMYKRVDVFANYLK